VCDLETIGAPSKFRLIRRAAALCPTLDLSCEENAHGLGPTEIKKKFFSFRGTTRFYGVVVSVMEKD
jgi:hypothetical protein